MVPQRLRFVICRDGEVPARDLGLRDILRFDHSDR